MRVFVAFIKPNGKSEKQILEILQNSGLEVHDITSVHIAKTTKRIE